MMRERKPWDRPVGSLTPNRMGDRAAEPLFAALGKAVSAWEGVQAATSSLYFAMRIGSAPAEADSGFQAFGGLNQVHKRRQELEERSRLFLAQHFGHNAEAVIRFGAELKSVLSAYVGWAERRNDIAHGYVTEAQTPDYCDPEQKIITVYALCPSHARIARWPHSEPEYNYVAADLEAFTESFRHLDDQFESLAHTADRLPRRND
jgi:hypothetical protein